MARPIKRGKTWRIEICVAGIRESASFPHRATAEQWAADRRRELLAQSRGEVVGGKTLAQAFARYSAEVSPLRRGARWEQIKLKAWSERMTFAGTALDELKPETLAEWRDDRLKVVSPGAVLRDFSLLSAVLEHCRREWRWIATNPARDVRKPPAPKGRDRRVTDAELEAVRQCSGDDTRTVSGRMYWAAKFAVCTGMRVGEICALQWSEVSEKSVHVSGQEIGAGKTDKAVRDVPLSLEAREILSKMPRTDGPVFTLKKGSVDVFWRRYTREAGLTDLHFHDLRHEAISRLSGKLQVMDLARMIGHSDPKMLLRYYHPDAGDLADRLG